MYATQHKKQKKTTTYRRVKIIKDHSLSYFIFCDKLLGVNGKRESERICMCVRICRLTIFSW
jgi:hypothetical protein